MYFNIYKNNKLLLKKALLCSSFWLKFKGFMFQRLPARYKTLLFYSGGPLHMFFVFFPLLIIYLDKNKIVLAKTTLKPWQIGFQPAAAYILESTILNMRNKIQIGDRLTFKKYS